MPSLVAAPDISPDSPELEAYTSSMPEAYALSYAADERAEHLELVKRRGEKPVLVERWRALSDGGAMVAVVADDRAGLLSYICAALVRHGLEVRIAQIYSRARSDETLEAVDFFWLRARDSSGMARSIEPHELERVQTTLTELVASPPAQPWSSASPLGGSLDPLPATRAFFNTKALRRGDYVLVVEALDYPGLLLAITSALHAQGVEIASSDVRTEGTLARDSFVLKAEDALSLSSQKLAAIRDAVLAAVREGRKQALGR